MPRSSALAAMSKLRLRWMQAVFSALLLLGLAVGWVTFAPAPLGGMSTYVIVNGDSMEPAFHLGDLVIVHQAEAYHIGDAVVYYNGDMKSLVFHRIIEQPPDRFILKGDHNTWTDAYLPTLADIRGKLWIHIPSLGKAILWLRTPIVLAAAVGGIVLVTVVLFLRGKGKGGKMEKNNGASWFDEVRKWTYHFLGMLFKKDFQPEMSQQPKMRAIPMNTGPGKNHPGKQGNFKSKGWIIDWSFLILGFLALAALALMLYSFRQPLLREVDDNLQYSQNGTFTYSSSAPAGVYNSTQVLSGDPLFPKLNCVVTFQFSYFLQGDPLSRLAGTYQLTAVISDAGSGWTRSLPLEKPTPFEGNTFIASAPLDICRVENMVTAFEGSTDLHPPLYLLSIVPDVSIQGQIADRSLQEQFQPALVFQFDKLHFYVLRPADAPDPFTPSQPGMSQGTRLEPNNFRLLGLTLWVAKTRLAASAVFLLALAGLVFLAVYTNQKIQHDEETQIALKYGSMLVDVKELPDGHALPSVSVITIDDLARLAERQNSNILHVTGGSLHQYFVQGDKLVYRFDLYDGLSDGRTGSLRWVEKTLPLGIERGEMQVFYQPIISLADGRITAVEALLRWQQLEHGLVPAADFISVAEKSGLIDKIGEWMLPVALGQFRQWKSDGLSLQLALNLSLRQLQGGAADTIISAVEKSGLDPDTLQVEVREQSLFDSNPLVIASLRALAEKGISLTVDHFTGQMPLAILARLPIRTIKIDCRATKPGEPERNAEKLGEMILAARKLGFNVVAEGIENEEQLTFFQGQTCDYAQGYLFGRPEPAEIVTPLLKSKSAQFSGVETPVKKRSKAK